jgi:hypothetical protein
MPRSQCDARAPSRVRGATTHNAIHHDRDFGALLPRRKLAGLKPTQEML